MSKKEIEETDPNSPPSNSFITWKEFFSSFIDIALILLALGFSLFKSRDQIFDLLSKRVDKKRKEIEKTFDKESVNCVQRMQALSNADRVVLGQFYNSTYYKSGLPRYRFNATHEALASPSVASVLATISEVPSERLHEEVALLESAPNKVVFANSYDQCLIINGIQYPMRDKCKNHLLSIGVEVTYEFLVSTSSGVVGIIAVQFLSRFSNTEKQSDLSSFNRNFKEIVKRRDYLESCYEKLNSN